jgi:predicted component of type VI protein secretion system
MPRLIAKSPEFAGQEFELTQSLITVGRVEGNAIQLTHPSVSSRHAELKKEGGDYRLIDHNSTNGTRVNDERVSEVMLRNQDTVMFGNIVLTYASEVALAAAPMPQTSIRVDMSGGTAGRPAGFANLAPFPKPKPKSGAVPVLVILAALIALGGVGFLVYQLFPSS